MIQEFRGAQRRVFRVTSAQTNATNIETEAVSYALDYYQDQLADRKTTAATSAEPRSVLRYIESWLQHLFLPVGYPESVTDDLLPVAIWDTMQEFCNNVVGALSMRAVLIGVGVGESAASVSSSVVSWMLRDGAFLLAQVLFAPLISIDMENRAKTWRLIADILNDAAFLMELCASSITGDRAVFRTVAVLASVVRAVVSVAGSGTRAALVQHFALCGNAADISAKASTRGSVGSLVGLIIGMTVTLLVPVTAKVWTLVAFLLFAGAHVYANYRGMRSVRLLRLNVPRLEWCTARYLRYRDQAVAIAKKTDEPTEAAASATLDLSPQRANAEESLFILPPLQPPPVLQRPLVFGGVAQYLKQCLYPWSLELQIYFGVSLFALLSKQTHLSARQKQRAVQQVEESLSLRGVALLLDDVRWSYYVIFPEFYNSDGEPSSWQRYRTQVAMMSRCRRGGATGGPQPLPTAGVPEHVSPLPYRQLWSFFYAFVHQSAAVDQAKHGQPLPTAIIARAENDAAAAAAAGAKEGRMTLHVISALRSDGVLDESKQRATPRSSAWFELATAPSTVSTRGQLTCQTAASGTAGQQGSLSHLDQRSGVESSQLTGIGETESDDDGLFESFVNFVRLIRASGWQVDRLQIPSDDVLVAVHYL